MYKGKLTDKLKTGELGEKIACEYLKKKGFKITEKNYQKKWGEIDIVAKKNNVLHFVEVKTVAHETNHSPEENIHSQKKQRISKTIQTYLIEKDISDNTEIQVDTIAVFLNKETRKVKVRFTENIIL